MSLTAGTRLGSYEIITLLGSGGMGEVYRAKDLKLEREVAIKVLPGELAADFQRLERFKREARTASALDHPNIVTIHDIAEEDGVHFIVMQYVEGKTLRTLVGQLKLSEALGYAIQIADGLAAAHAHGIVHRDLKPDNVIVNRQGLAKILDFGLAKLTEPAPGDEAATLDRQSPLTQEGHILGTAGYMSPEQAEGQTVDARSDIFSFGSVLYEMVTGHRAFEGKSVPSVLAAILRDEPAAVRERLPAVPVELERVIARALRKKPERRFQSMADLKVALVDLKEELESGTAITADRISKHPARWRALVAALVVLGLGAAAWLYFGRPSLPPPRVLPVTSLPGFEAEPALSPDGKQVTFTWSDESADNSDLYVRLVDSGQQLRLTDTPEDEFGPTWSPDGTRIAFLRHVEDESGNPVDGIFVISSLGGPERLLTTTRTHEYGLSWGPDGEQLAIVDKDVPEGPNGIFLFSLESGEKWRLTAPPADYLTGALEPRFSPDGGTLAFVRQRVVSQSDIYLVPVRGGEPRRLTFGNHNTAGLDWTPDGESILFSSSRSPRGGFWSLWRISASGGEPQPVEVSGQGIYPTLSREGNRLAYVKLDWKWDIWRVGGPSATEEEKTSTDRFIASTWLDYVPQYSPDGQKVLFTSSRSGHQEIWISDNDGSNAQQLTFLEDPLTNTGSWSPDGQRIAFMSPKEGSYDIYVVNATGGVPRRLTTGPAEEMTPTWSRDGRWIYFQSNPSGRFEVWKIPEEGGEPNQLTKHGGTTRFESPDGQFLYFGKLDAVGGPQGVWRIPIDGGEEVQVLEHAGFNDWAVTEQGICYVNREADPRPAIEYLDFATGEVSRVTELDEAPFWGFRFRPTDAGFSTFGQTARVTSCWWKISAEGRSCLSLQALAPLRPE
jgi:Tol biopolymer transport system component